MTANRPEMRFFKMSGGGNDFIALQDSEFLTPNQVETLCARGHSLGADGVFSIDPQAGSEQPAVRMAYFNADGTRAGLCVNGTRCAAMLAFYLRLASDRVTIVTDAGAIEAFRTGKSEIALELAPPVHRPIQETVVVDGADRLGWFLDTGVPHWVLEWPENLVTAPVAEWGSEIRHAPQFEHGANADFVRFLDSGRLEIRTFERGVEGETLACGTGVLAAAAVAVELGRAGFPMKALTSGGFELTVDGSIEDGSIVAWTLSGDARLVAEGVLSDGALSIPAPPLWSD